MKQLVGALLLIAVPAIAAQVQLDNLESLKGLYGYDAEQPLDVQETFLFEKDWAKVYDITYASPKKGRVTAYLVVPAGDGPHAGLVFGHWGPGNRTEFLSEALLYAEVGAASLLIDYPWVRPAPWRQNLQFFGAPESDHENFIQAVVELRRGIDVLLARADVDPNRLAYIGHSYGAQWGAILSAVDDRIKAAVLIGGAPDLASIFLKSDAPEMVNIRETVPEEDMEKYLQVNACTDPVHYVEHADPTPILFQFARHERYFDEAIMNKYYQAAREPKAVRWYDTGHELNDMQALIDRSNWMRDKIEVGSITEILVRRLQEE